MAEELKDVLPLHPIDFMILLSLLEEPKHGWAIKKSVEKMLNGDYSEFGSVAKNDSCIGVDLTGSQ